MISNLSSAQYRQYSEKYDKKTSLYTFVIGGFFSMIVALVLGNASYHTSFTFAEFTFKLVWVVCISTSTYLLLAIILEKVFNFFKIKPPLH